MIKKSIYFLLALTIILSGLAHAGPFRHITQFNESADGFWMKGRCTVAKFPWGFNGDQRLFSDIGCVVKNRKGKRRPKRRHAHIDIDTLFVGFDRGGRWSSSRLPTQSCQNETRCSSKVSAVRLETPFLVEGAVYCIGGNQNGRARHTFEVPVGNLPPRDNSPISVQVDNFKKMCEQGLIR